MNAPANNYFLLKRLINFCDSNLNLSNLQVGEHNKCNWEDDHEREKLIASDLWVHPNYNKPLVKYNDIAIIKVFSYLR